MSSSKYADEGTIAHALATMALNEQRPASAYINRVIESADYEHAGLSPSGAPRWMVCPGSHALETRIKFVPRKFQMTVTREMADDVQIYLDNAFKYTTLRDAQFFVEQKLPIEHLTGEKGATGSGDLIVLDFAAYELQAHDLKFGKGVEVSAENNEQLAIYLLSAWELFADFEPQDGWQTFRGVIHQPRITEAPSEWTWTRAELLAFKEKIKAKVAMCEEAKRHLTDGNLEKWSEAYLLPGEKQCKFCDAKPTCPALERLVQEKVAGDFSDLTTPESGINIVKDIPMYDPHTLADKLAAIPIIEAWCSAVAAHAEAELLAGREVPGYKVVQGKRGNRKWGSDDLAEAAMKSMRLKQDEMYDFSLISPTTAEKRLKEQPKRWARLVELITQTDGKPTVAPDSDKRPALVVTPTVEDFQNLEELV